MKITICLTLVCIIIVNDCVAQNMNIFWERTYGGSQSDLASTVISTSDGNILVGGSTNSYDGDIGIFNSDIDKWILKIDNNGNIIWKKRYVDPYDELLYNIIPTQKGYLLVSALYPKFSATGLMINKIDDIGNKLWEVTLSIENTSLFYTNHYVDKDSNIVFLIRSYNINTKDENVLLLKMDKDGKEMWRKDYGGSKKDILDCILPDSNNGYLIMGSTYSNDGDINSNIKGISDLWVIKIDEFGEIIWGKTYGKSSSEQFGDAIKISENEYVILGTTRNPNNMTFTDNDVWLLKINNSGVIIWEKTYGKSSVDELGRKILPVLDGFLIGSVTSEHIGVIKTDVNGNLKWNYKFGRNQYEQISQMVTLDNGEFLISVNSYAGEKSYDINLFRINKEGKLISEKQLGGSRQDICKAIFYKNNILILGGVTESNDYDIKSGNHGKNDYWVVRFDINLSTSLSSEIEIPDYNIYPIPVLDKLFIEINSNPNKTIRIYNMEGQLQLQQKISLGINELDFRNKSKGIYFVKVFDEEGHVYTRKIVK